MSPVIPLPSWLRGSGRHDPCRSTCATAGTTCSVTISDSNKMRLIYPTRLTRPTRLPLYCAAVLDDVDGRADHLPPFVEPLDHVGAVRHGDAARDVVPLAAGEDRLTPGLHLG